jgi:protein PsiE
MPVRFLLYVAITAVTRHLIGFVNTHPAADPGLMYLAGAVLVLAVALLVVRYATFAFGTAASARDGTDVAGSDLQPPAKSARP